MTRPELDAILAKYDLKVDGWHAGAGQFADLEIGVGADIVDLVKAQVALQDARLECQTIIRRVDNREHPQYAKPYLEVASFWNE